MRPLNVLRRTEGVRRAWPAPDGGLTFETTDARGRRTWVSQPRSTRASSQAVCRGSESAWGESAREARAGQVPARACQAGSAPAPRSCRLRPSSSGWVVAPPPAGCDTAARAPARVHRPAMAAPTSRVLSTRAGLRILTARVGDSTTARRESRWTTRRPCGRGPRAGRSGSVA